MRRTARRFGLGCAAALGLSGSAASGAQNLRIQVDQTGDFVVIGNTLAHDCAGPVPAPVVGAVGACGFNTGDTAPDVFWRSESPGAGQAEANTGISLAESRSTAILAVPGGAQITHAYLYWAAKRGANTPDADVVFERPGGSSGTVTALDGFTIADGGNTVYQSVADVTAEVLAAGPGAFRVSGVSSINLVNANEQVAFAAWSLVVFYTLDTDPPRNLALFDGLDRISDGNPSAVTLDGFLVPTAGFDAKLGAITYEGDDTLTGDELLFGPGTLGAADRLTNGQNPIDNFFNGTRSLLGAPVSVVGDLPQLLGTAGSMSGFDLDVVDVTDRMTSGQTSANIQATSSGDTYFLGAFVTSVSTFRPTFDTSGKTVTDLNGGAVAPGDELEYTVVAENTGNDASIGTVLTDPLPAGVAYVPNSLVIDGTPVQDSDPVVDVVGTTLTVRIGTGADGAQGGLIPIGGSVTVTFRVTVLPTAAGTISNQAIITASGELGAPADDTPTDGNGVDPGQPPTEVPVGGCDTDADCAAPRPVCDLSTTPGVCVQCQSDAQCAAPTPLCDAAVGLCVGCLTDTDCGGATPACLASGTCGQCSPTNDTACVDPTPLCDASAGLCVGCQGDGDCAAPTPACTQASTCGQCSGTNQTECTGAVPVCNVGIATCVGVDTDTDGDGIPDGEEQLIGLDPNDADSDDDGVIDGEEPSYGEDSDGDGAINALDADSDNDGLFDGTELGRDCSGPATDASRGHCVPDADAGATTTDPLNADTDGGGVSDGNEDTNLDGAVDAGETNPTAGQGADDGVMVDTDGDGLSDALEAFLGSDPNDADSDDDGVPDGQEANPADDVDGDGLIDVLDVDSDNDGLFDGTEVGRSCDGPGTNAAAGHCIPDADGGATTTSMILRDTDGGGAIDGSEDANRNGVVDPGEQDPTVGNAADDASVVDTDGDGLSDALEATLGTDPNDADSDDDGVPDGEEANFGNDEDGDGRINALDEDSDGDGILDGTERGTACTNPATDIRAGNCRADADGGATTTSMVNADTDRGGVSDGVEDANQDGAVDPGENDPNDPADDFDVPPTGTGGMGGMGNAGMGGAPVTGGFGGTAATGAVPSTGGMGAVGAAGGTSPLGDSGSLEGGGCACNVGSEGTRGAPTGLLLGLLGLARLRRRRREPPAG